MSLETQPEGKLSIQVETHLSLKAPENTQRQVDLWSAENHKHRIPFPESTEIPHIGPWGERRRDLQVSPDDHVSVNQGPELDTTCIP